MQPRSTPEPNKTKHLPPNNPLEGGGGRRKGAPNVPPTMPPHSHQRSSLQILRLRRPSPLLSPHSSQRPPPRPRRPQNSAPPPRQPKRPVPRPGPRHSRIFRHGPPPDPHPRFSTPRGRRSRPDRHLAPSLRARQKPHRLPPSQPNALRPPTSHQQPRQNPTPHGRPSHSRRFRARPTRRSSRRASTRSYSRPNASLARSLNLLPVYSLLSTVCSTRYRPSSFTIRHCPRSAVSPASARSSPSNRKST